MRITTGSVWECQQVARKRNGERYELEPFVVVESDSNYVYGVSYFSDKPRAITRAGLMRKYRRAMTDKKKVEQVLESGSYKKIRPRRCSDNPAMAAEVTRMESRDFIKVTADRVGTGEYSRLTGLTSDAITYRCSVGKLDAIKVCGRWMIARPTGTPKMAVGRNNAIKEQPIAPARVGLFRKIVMFFKGEQQ